MTNIVDADQYASNEQLDHEYHTFRTQVDLPRSVVFHFECIFFTSWEKRKEKVLS